MSIRPKATSTARTQAWTINDNDQLQSGKDYTKIIIAYRNGAPVRLTDVATIIDGAEDTHKKAWVNDTPAIVLNIQRQPGTNIIGVVDTVTALLPQIRASLPQGVELQVITDRTTTIRASVEDVEFELMLTIALVVMVIFLFLRSLSATIIPGIAVPLSLVGTFGVMYMLGYSLDNLSLMALTISTGFVVDDAIVMIENIARYLEMGDSPMQAALKGSAEIGFTIVSLTVSLIAVLIPLLFMADIVGRLFREFAVTLAVTIIFSAFVSLTLTPMMAARILKHKPEHEQGRFYRWSEWCFVKTIEQYGKMVRVVLRHQPMTLLVAVGTLALTTYLYIIVPKGFFPVQDTGVILGISQAPETISFVAMGNKQQELARVILQDPAVENLTSFIGVDGQNTTMNSGRIQITLKPLEERKISAVEVIRRLQQSLNQVSGITLYMQPVQDLTVEDRISRTQYQYALDAPDKAMLDLWIPRLVDKMKADSRTARRSQRSAEQRVGIRGRHRSRYRGPPRHHPAERRRRALRRIRAAAGLDDLYAVQPVSCGPRSRAAMAAERGFTERHLCADRIGFGRIWLRRSLWPAPIPRSPARRPSVRRRSALSPRSNVFRLPSPSTTRANFRL